MTAQRRKPSSAQRAVEEIRDLILTNELPAGASYLETELAERLGMSRTPVREALLVLETQGLVEMRPRKGARIKALSAEDMREIYDILTELESLAAERAAEAGLSEEALAPLSGAIREMEAALERGDREAWARGDEAFHDALVRLGGNRRVEGVVSMFNDQVRRARALTLHMRPLPTKSNEDHRALLEAIRRGDAAQARALHRRHRIEARDMLTDLLDRHGLRRV